MEEAIATCIHYPEVTELLYRVDNTFGTEGVPLAHCNLLV